MTSAPRRRVEVTMALAAVVLVATAVVASASAAIGSVRPHGGLAKVQTCKGADVVRPVSYVVACADSGIYLSDLSWSRWARTAEASGVFYEDDCVPNCASGTFHHFHAVVALSAPVPTATGLLYSNLKVVYSTPSGRSSVFEFPLLTS